MNILIIDSGITEFKNYNANRIYPTGFRGQNTILSIQDSYGHGTAVADLVTRNHQDLNVYILKLFDSDTTCALSDLIAALEFVVNGNKYQVINMSFGITAFQAVDQIAHLQSLCDVLTKQGSVLVTAFDNLGAVSYPACFDSVIGVDCSRNARNKSEYEYIQNSIVTIKGYGANQKVAWKDLQYTIAGGTSFACANISNHIISLIKSHTSRDAVMNALKDGAVKIRNFNKCPSIQVFPEWLRNSRAVILPFNKEIHSFLAFENLLAFSIAGVYDFKYTARIGRDAKDLLSYRNVRSNIIQNYDKLDWSSDAFDIVVAGHLGEMSWRCKKDLLEEIVIKCCRHNKKLAYEKIIADSGVPTADFYYPKISDDMIPKGRFGKLHEIMTPVVAVVGTSSQQGKFTVQLALRDLLQRKGYAVGQIGSEPSSQCFSMDYVFPNGYSSTVSCSGPDSITLLNQMVHEIDLRSADICIVGAQSGTIPYSMYNLSTIPLAQTEFLIGTNPDAFILCVNPHDEIDYIKRTVYSISSYYASQCAAVVVYPLVQEPVVGGLFKKKNIADTESYYDFKRRLKANLQVDVYDMDSAINTDTLADHILDYFTAE